MKRILAGIAAAVILAVSSVGVFAAGTANIEVRNDKRTVSYNYSEFNTKETVKPITELFSNVKDITTANPSVTQVITIKSNTDLAGVINFTLRMVDTKDYEDDASADDSVLTYYNVNITDSDGELIAKTSADDADIIQTDEGQFIKNIELGKLNTQFTTETKIYNVEISVPSDIAERNIAEARENTEWDLVSVPARFAESAASENESEANDKDTDSEATPVPTESATQSPAATTAPTQAAETQNNAKGVKYVGEGKDIVPGRYVVTGNGLVKVYNDNDELKTSILLTDGKSQSEDGIESYVLNLTDGGRVEISDYINLRPYPTATASPSATATPKATTAAKAAATAAPKATAAAASAKTNPKTGDTMPVTAVSVIAVLSLGVCVFIEISKRKKN